MARSFGTPVYATLATILGLCILVFLSTYSAPTVTRQQPGSTIIYDPTAPTFHLSSQALDSSKLPFANHSTLEPYQSYLQQTLDFTHFQSLFDSVNNLSGGGILRTRGEAHITVISPPEYDMVLKPAGLTIEEIEGIALRSKIQAARIAPVCLGRFKGRLKEEEQEGELLLFSLVVADVYGDLMAIRRDVFKLFRERGGQGALFQPEAFWPHVTIGYNQRDLFVQDGIYKGSNYCYAPVRAV
ncbi:hypothetical protein GGF37_000234 [Kickxella alabastrina]|nr:hypothetical protein GGF37_000234 [Kickxella alabastrina]